MSLEFPFLLLFANEYKKVKVRSIFPRVYKIDGKLATLSRDKNVKVYDEKIFRIRNKEYREFKPERSKLAAAIKKGLKFFPFDEKSDVLYLGASSGTTSSHVSDICKDGLVYCVEISSRMMLELLRVARMKDNIIPILADANRPEEYANLIGKVDIIYQDVAQKNQAEILIKNFLAFKPRYAMLAIKARSISSIQRPEKVFREEIEKLKKYFKIIEKINLEPYHKDHLLISMERR
ncbi:MAG TPA: fibrillarin-like rRNA/tRNA 2'-O-methyltransferase [Candidatus Altiarchaeales archaeon]|nr:fibrillarin-like rRNA/tRNA 2'-O-methyltransferase [Candidatus Altiarchaeales archaeon]